MEHSFLSSLRVPYLLHHKTIVIQPRKHEIKFIIHVTNASSIHPML